MVAAASEVAERRFTRDEPHPGSSALNWESVHDLLPEIDNDREIAQRKAREPVDELLADPAVSREAEALVTVLLEKGELQSQEARQIIAQAAIFDT